MIAAKGKRHIMWFAILLAIMLGICLEWFLPKSFSRIACRPDRIEHCTAHYVLSDAEDWVVEGTELEELKALLEEGRFVHDRAPRPNALEGVPRYSLLFETTGGDRLEIVITDTDHLRVREYAADGKFRMQYRLCSDELICWLEARKTGGSFSS